MGRLYGHQLEPGMNGCFSQAWGTGLRIGARADTIAPMLTLTSINIATPVALNPNQPGKKTGICKLPAMQGVVGPLGLAGDAVVNTKHHGGPDQAVYIYGQADYDWWAGQGIAVAPGLFGENLTIGGMASVEFAVGDRLEIGEVVLEVTAPRIPCATFAARMGDPAWVKRFRDGRRPGLYARVIAGGTVVPGMDVTIVPFEGDRYGIGEQFDLYFARSPSREDVARVLALPVAIREREHYEAVLERLGL